MTKSSINRAQKKLDKRNQQKRERFLTAMSNSPILNGQQQPPQLQPTNVILGISPQGNIQFTVPTGQPAASTIFMLIFGIFAVMYPLFKAMDNPSRIVPASPTDVPPSN